MKTNKAATLCCLLVIGALAATPCLAQDRKALSIEQQKQLLSRRLPGNAIAGTFGSYGSLLFSVLDVAIHNKDQQIGATVLHSPFPEFYKPTIGELLDTIASQTQSSWTYDPKTDYWVFAKPAKPKPFSITLADKWTATDEGVYVGYKPPNYPVGMDIYYYGTYSADKPEQEPALATKIRNSWAIGFASNLNPKITPDEMKGVTVDGVEALYFESPAPRPGVVWRQWALVKNRHAFVIVSSLPAHDEQLRSAVESMVKSFRGTP